MSLTSLFVGSDNRTDAHVDEGLDAIFRSSAGPSSLYKASHADAAAAKAAQAQMQASKKRKASDGDAPADTRARRVKAPHALAVAEDAEPENKDAGAVDTKERHKKKKKGKGMDVSGEGDGGDPPAGLPDANDPKDRRKKKHIGKEGDGREEDGGGNTKDTKEHRKKKKDKDVGASGEEGNGEDAPAGLPDTNNATERHKKKKKGKGVDRSGEDDADAKDTQERRKKKKGKDADKREQDDSGDSNDTKERRKKKDKAKATTSSGKENGRENAPAPIPADKATSSRDTRVASSHQNRDSDTDTDDPSAEPPQHESLTHSAGEAPQRHAGKAKYTPDGETRAQRDARTVFVGNLPPEVTKSRPLLKQLKRQILAAAPGAQIESVRFRSVPFKNPTAYLASDADADGPSSKQQRQQKRAETWREAQGDGGAGAEKEDVKRYLTPKEKRRVAFIRGELHTQAGDVHAYIVFAYPPPSAPGSEGADPREAARAAAQLCDGMSFGGRTLRVDLVGGDAEGARAGAVDPRRSVFVGNLDFASNEEDLRVFFEVLVSAERGAMPTDDGEGEGADVDGKGAAEEEAGKSARQRTWVTRVRIVRDRDTQVGKGFAYVQFADRECVNEVLALAPEQLHFAKRTLRVQRCKTLPAAGATTKVKELKTEAAGAARRTASGGVPVVPRGDPTLGARLAGLPKDVRKTVKAAEAARVARRLAKKKARGALERAGVRPEGKVRVRERVRKERPGPGGKKNTGRKEGKRRVRSDKALAKKSVKKA